MAERDQPRTRPPGRAQTSTAAPGVVERARRSTSSLPNEPLWPRAGRSGSRAAARSSSSSTTPAWRAAARRRRSGGVAPAESDRPLRHRAPPRRGRGASLARAAARRPPRLAQPPHAGEDAPLAVVEARLDVGREEEPAASRPDAERDRDRVVRLVADRDRDPVHAQLLGPGRGAAVEADRRLAGGQPLDLDVAPADAADAQPEDLATRPPWPPSGRPWSRAGRARSAARRRQDPLRNRSPNLRERAADALDLDDVDAQLGRARRHGPRRPVDASAVSARRPIAPTRPSRTWRGCAAGRRPCPARRPCGRRTAGAG